MSTMIRTLSTPDGRVLKVAGTKGWTVAARRALVESELEYVLKTPVRFSASGIRHAGNLHAIHGRPDVLVRLNGGVVDREHRVSLHVVRQHHDALVRHVADGGRAFQLGVAAVPPIRGGRAMLALGCFDYALLAPGIDCAFEEREVRRVNLTMAAQRAEGGGLALRVPEFAMPLAYGVEELARALEMAPGTSPAASLTTEERMAVVAAVLELEHGLHTSVAHLDARTRVAHRCLHDVGLPDAAPHRLFGRAAPCSRPHLESLARTDLIGASRTRDLLADPSQALTLVEVEHHTRDAIRKVAARLVAAEQLGLRVADCIIVVRDEDEDWCRRQLAHATAVVRSKARVETMSEWHARYVTLQRGYLSAQRALVRRAAA